MLLVVPRIRAGALNDVSRTTRGWLALVASLLTGGCRANPGPDTERTVAAELQTRTGSAPNVGANEPAGPDGVDLTDGLDADEAVALALWHSPDFAVALAGLGITRADLGVARSWKDPVFSFLFPVGPKQYEWTLNLPIEGLWQRPARIARAELDLERAGEELVRAGLDLVRDVRLDWIDAVAARRVVTLDQQAVDLATEGLRLAEARLEAGEATPGERDRARLALDHARIAAARSHAHVQTTRLQLEARLGVALEGAELAEASTGGGPSVDVAALEDTAIACRPEVRAAELRVESAARDAGIARADAWKLSLLVDANQKGDEGFEVGPGIALTLPVLDGGSAAGERARAALEQAVRELRAAAARVRAELRTADVALQERQRLLTDQGDALEGRAIELSERAQRRLALGEAAPSESLDARRAALDARRTALDLELDVLRGRVALEHALGCSLDRASQRLGNERSDAGAREP
jgi:cobalt-zinc-cadmium efflux system outer membrane protein